MKRRLTEKEVKDIAYNSLYDEEGEDRRWSRSMFSVGEIEGKFYGVVWEKGLTENQDNEFWEQEVDEVKEVKEEKTIIVTKWIPVD